MDYRLEILKTMLPNYEKEVENIMNQNHLIIEKTNSSVRDENINIAGSVGTLRSLISFLKEITEEQN